MSYHLDMKRHLTFSYQQLRHAEMELTKGENMMKHEEEIFSRPARTWFQTNKEKEQAKGRPSLF